MIRGEEAFPNATCQYVIGRPNGKDIGDRMQVVVSTFLYAILTNRALLLDDTDMLNMLCDPFKENGYNGTWRISGSGVSEVEEIQNKGPFLDTISKNKDGELVLIGKDKEVGLNLGLDGDIDQIFLDLAFGYGHSAQNFYCDDSQKTLKKVTFVVILTEQFFAPGLFLIPSFATVLEEMFPDRSPFHHISKYLLNPNNFLWERISRLHETHLKNANSRIGVQLKAFAEKPDRNVRALLSCLNNVSEVLAPPINHKEWSDIWKGYRKGMNKMKWKPGQKERVEKVISNRKPEKIVLFLSPLHARHALEISRQYQEGVSEDGSIVNVVYFMLNDERTSSQFGVSQRGLAKQEQEVVDIFLLSFCESLFTTFFSTAGYVSAGLQGKPQYLVDINGAGGFNIKKKEYSCVQSESCEPCFHFPPHERQCGKNKNKTTVKKGYEIPELPYFTPCLDTERGRGRRMWNSGSVSS